MPPSYATESVAYSILIPRNKYYVYVRDETHSTGSSADVAQDVAGDLRVKRQRRCSLAFGVHNICGTVWPLSATVFFR